MILFRVMFWPLCILIIESANLKEGRIYCKYHPGFGSERCSFVQIFPKLIACVSFDPFLLIPLMVILYLWCLWFKLYREISK